MKICVAGAGAIGGFMGARLAGAGNDVTLVTIGEDLEAIRANGLEIICPNGRAQRVGPFALTDEMQDLGPQDLVILAVKAHQIETISFDLPALYSPETVVLTIQNGIPWWYFHRSDGAFAGHRLECADPNGTIEHNIPAERVIGCVAYPAVVRTAPGVLRHVEGSRFPVGELDGSHTGRVRRVANCLEQAGFKAPVLSDIRGEIWLKALGALAFNPLSALTRATLVDICLCPETRNLAKLMMQEAERVARTLGVSLRLPIEKRIAGAAGVGAHKTSMLQDVENGQPLEVDATLLSVIEIGRLTGTSTPTLEAIYACIKLLDSEMAARVSGR